MPLPIIMALAPSLIKAGTGVAKQLKADKAAGKQPDALGLLSAGLSPKTAGQNRLSSESSSPKSGATSRRDRPSAEQLAAAQVIGAEFTRARLPPGVDGARKALIVAALANAWAESRWDPAARNATAREDSVGLFQANRMGGLGTGYTVAQLSDPRLNTQLVIAEVHRRAAQLSPVAQRGTLADLVAAFTVHVERPASADLRGRERAQLAREWLGSKADRPAWGWSGR